LPEREPLHGLIEIAAKTEALRQFSETALKRACLLIVNAAQQLKGLSRRQFRLELGALAEHHANAVRQLAPGRKAQHFGRA
jgi:hypothetical protein